MKINFSMSADLEESQKDEVVKKQGRVLIEKSWKFNLDCDLFHDCMHFPGWSDALFIFKSHLY